MHRTFLEPKSHDVRSQHIEAPYYRQNDPRWANLPLGRTDKTLEEVGCTVSCVSMAMAHYGVEVTPQSLNAYLTENDGYNERGWLIWRKCVEYAGGRIRIAYLGDARDDLIDEHLSRKDPVIAKVTLENGMAHWVLIVGKSADGAYLVHDPLDLGGNGAPRRLTEADGELLAMRVFEAATELVLQPRE